MDWIGQHWLEWASLLFIAAGVWWLMPRAARRSKVVGVLLALAGTGLLATRVDDMTSPVEGTALFWLFASTAIIGGVLMITHRNPVYSALWFAVAPAILSVSLLIFAVSEPQAAGPVVTHHVPVSLRDMRTLPRRYWRCGCWMRCCNRARC